LVIDMKKRLLPWMILLFCSTSAIFGQQTGGQSPQPSILDEKTKAPKPAHNMSTKDVADKLQKGLDNRNAAYSGSNIKAVVDDQSVTLNGTVNSQSQHEMALQLAGAYGGDRKIIDRLVVQPQ
jgi:osmotically-inducible protein OsmY